MILDTNGNGKRDEYVEPNQPVDPKKDKRIVAGFYAVMPSPVDGSVWGTSGLIPVRWCGSMPGSESHRDGADGNLQRSAARVRAFAAATSTSKASSGYRSRAVISAASTGASAKVRSMGRRRPAIIVPKAGRFYQYPGPGFQGSSAKIAPSRAITPGSTSTTLSDSARMCRCLQAICTMG